MRSKSAVISAISVFATDERGELARQVVREVIERTQRRKVGDQVRCDQLIDAFGLRQILEPMRAEIAQAALRRQLVSDELRARTREEHLTAVADRK